MNFALRGRRDFEKSGHSYGKCDHPSTFKLLTTVTYIYQIMRFRAPNLIFGKTPSKIHPIHPAFELFKRPVRIQKGVET